MCLRVRVHFFKGHFSPKGLLSLGLPKKTPEVVLLKDEAAWKMNFHQIRWQLRKPSSPQSSTSSCLVLAGSWCSRIHRRLGVGVGGGGTSLCPALQQPFETGMCLFLSGWPGLKLISSGFPHQGEVGAREITSGDSE